MWSDLKTEFPQIPIRLVFCLKNLGANTKVSNLAQMATEAKYEHFVVNDSDIRVETSYLRSVAAPLLDPKAGLVTCLYRGVASASLGSWLESLFISTDFSAGCWRRGCLKAASDLDWVPRLLSGEVISKRRRVSRRWRII